MDVYVETLPDYYGLEKQYQSGISEAKAPQIISWQQFFTKHY